MEEFNTLTDNYMQIGPFMPRSPTMRIRTIAKNGVYKRRSVPSKTMVKSAITTLMRNPRVGVSLQAIRKYIEENYNDCFTNANNRFRFIKKYIKNSLESGELIRTKGFGISGSFRLPLAKQSIKKKSPKITKKKEQIRENKNTRRKLRKHLKELGLNRKTYRAELKIKKNTVMSGETESNA
uniref:Histone H1.3 n=2 Tax=Ceratitis capitata TaxID=7213 RepID=W8BNN3_CERCA